MVISAESGKARGRLSDALKTALDGKSVEQSLKDGEFDLMGEYDSGVPRPKPDGDFVIKTFKIAAEGDGERRLVDVAAQRDRVVYRLRNSSDSPLHEMFVAASLNEVIYCNSFIQ